MRNSTNWSMLAVIGAALGLTVLSPGTAKAALISIDPGPVGSSFQDKTIAFGDLNGTVLGGQSLDLDFVFSDMKHLVPVFNDTDPLFDHSYAVVVTLFHDLGAAPGSPAFAEGYLSDENGAPLVSGISTIVGQGTDFVLFNLLFLETTVDGLIHHDIHVSTVLPNQSAAQVIGGELRLVITSPQGEIQVGEWGPQVPEPSTLVLWSLGAVTLVGLGWRRRKWAA